MEKSTVIEILRTFSKEELAEFCDFTLSPYFSKKSNVTKLYMTLRKSAPAFPSEKIEKEVLWKSVFPGKRYNYGIMKNLIHELNKLVVRFLDLKVYSQKPLDSDLNQMDGYKLRNLKSQLIKKAAETRKNLKQRPLDRLSHYYNYMIHL